MLGIAGATAFAVPTLGASGSSAVKVSADCVPFGSAAPDAVRIVNGAFNSTGRQTTEYLPHGAYRVSRCDANGDLIDSQTVGPILTPDGWVNLPYSATTRAPGGGYVDTTPTYADPTDPQVVKSWRGAAYAQRFNIPPTQTQGVQP